MIKYMKIKRKRKFTKNIGVYENCKNFLNSFYDNSYQYKLFIKFGLI